MNLKITKQLRTYLREQGIALTELADGTSVLLDISGHQVLSLNATGTLLVHHLLEAGTNGDALVDKLTDEFHIDREQANADVSEFLSNLSKTLGCTPS